MSKLVLLWLTFAMALLFLVLPKTVSPYDYFLFSDMKLHFATHIYFITERLSFILFAYVIASSSDNYREELKIFLLLLVADLVDYLLCYSEVWFYYNEFPISMSILKVVIFGGIILRTWIRQLR